jgi:hypothetical protein
MKYRKCSAAPAIQRRVAAYTRQVWGTVCEGLIAPDDLVQVRVHQLRDLVHVVEVLLALRRAGASGARGRPEPIPPLPTRCNTNQHLRWLDVDQRDDVVVLQKSQQLNLSERPAGAPTNNGAPK